MCHYAFKNNVFAVYLDDDMTDHFTLNVESKMYSGAPVDPDDGGAAFTGESENFLKTCNFFKNKSRLSLIIYWQES